VGSRRVSGLPRDKSVHFGPWSRRGGGADRRSLSRRRQAPSRSQSVEGLDLELEALMVVDRVPPGKITSPRASVRSLAGGLCDGSALHASRSGVTRRSVKRWRARVHWSPWVLRLRCSAEVMIDPRGGAPTTGLGSVRAWRSVRRMSTTVAPGRCSAEETASWCSELAVSWPARAECGESSSIRRDRSRGHIDDVLKVEFRTRLW